MAESGSLKPPFHLDQEYDEDEAHEGGASVEKGHQFTVSMKIKKEATAKINKTVKKSSSICELRRGQ